MGLNFDSCCRDSVLNLIIAGRDTTAQALGWTFFRLLAQPELFEPIRQEADANPVVDYDSYKNMTQTIAVFHEGLRLHPSVPKNMWRALGDDQIPGGPEIKASYVPYPGLLSFRNIILPLMAPEY